MDANFRDSFPMDVIDTGGPVTVPVGKDTLGRVKPMVVEGWAWMIGMKFRYSVRACLVVTCVVASLCYWRVRPGMVANRFVNSLAAKDYTRANRMLDERMSLDLVYWATNGKDMNARAELARKGVRLEVFGRGDVPSPAPRGASRSA